MKTKKIMLGVEDVEQASKDSTKMRTLENEKDKKLRFENIKEFRKAITPKRIELLHITRKMKPKSINELARLLERDIKSISTDLHLLENLGLINLKRNSEGRKEVIPVVDYARISLEIIV